MTDIELETKSDRELLILAVQRVNETHTKVAAINGNLQEVVIQQAVMKARCNERHPKYAAIKPAGIGAGITGLIFGIVELVKMLIGK